MLKAARQTQENVAMTARAQVVIFGIGRAARMARKRGMTNLQRDALHTLGA
ncbi:central glycolytic regulator, partial [Megasphaera massiliensis]|nr:central glycolytic regulator [Megasphaera massiliensis]